VERGLRPNVLPESLPFTVLNALGLVCKPIMSIISLLFITFVGG
jgi:hypothetical protein